jgi:acetolactate synthase-1/2/3 large subunit
MRYRLGIVVVLVNNGSYGSIRMHQEREYPGRPVATDLENPDFVALARSYGAYGEQVERTEDFPAAYRRAASCGGPALLELKIGIEDMLAANPRA